MQAPVTWVWTLVTYVLLALAMALIWLVPRSSNRGGSRVGAARPDYPAADT